MTARGAMARPVRAASPAAKTIAEAVNQSIEIGAIPGASVAVMRHGKVLLSKGFGRANLETGAAMTADSVLRIASLTKQFTAAAAIKLSALGQLDLKAPVSDLLPAFKPLKPFSALELIHHTAGLHSDESEGAGFALAGAKNQRDLAALIAAQPQPFDFDPGTAWLYSNANYTVLGALIEQVAHRPLAQAMADLVFAPLDLATLAFDTAADIVPLRAAPYTRSANKSARFVNAAYIDPAYTGGAGAMRGTATELCKWHHALLGLQLFGRAQLDLMLAPGMLRDGRPASANRVRPEDSSYGDSGYAGGLVVSGPGDAMPSINHYGAINGFCSLLQTYPRQGLSFAVLCNADIGPDVPFRAVRKAVIEAWLR